MEPIVPILSDNTILCELKSNLISITFSYHDSLLVMSIIVRDYEGVPILFYVRRNKRGYYVSASMQNRRVPTFFKIIFATVHEWLTVSHLTQYFVYKFSNSLNWTWLQKTALISPFIHLPPNILLQMQFPFRKITCRDKSI